MRAITTTTRTATVRGLPPVPALEVRTDRRLSPATLALAFTRSRAGVRGVRVLAAIAACIALYGHGTPAANAGVTHARLQRAMAAYGVCRSGFHAITGESATEGRAVLLQDLFGTAPITRRPVLSVYYGDQRRDPDGRHVEWWTRNGVRQVLFGFNHVRQVAGMLNRLRSRMDCR